MSKAATCAPCRHNSSAKKRPMPLEAPVTMVLRSAIFMARSSRPVAGRPVQVLCIGPRHCGAVRLRTSHAAASRRASGPAQFVPHLETTLDVYTKFACELETTLDVYTKF